MSSKVQLRPIESLVVDWLLVHSLWYLVVGVFSFVQYTSAPYRSSPFCFPPTWRFGSRLENIAWTTGSRRTYVVESYACSFIWSRCPWFRSFTESCTSNPSSRCSSSRCESVQSKVVLWEVSLPRKWQDLNNTQISSDSLPKDLRTSIGGS